jgi:hypothetical protein
VWHPAAQNLCTGQANSEQFGRLCGPSITLSNDAVARQCAEFARLPKSRCRRVYLFVDHPCPCRALRPTPFPHGSPGNCVSPRSHRLDALPRVPALDRTLCTGPRNCSTTAGLPGRNAGLRAGAIGCATGRREQSGRETLSAPTARTVSRSCPRLLSL